MKAERREERERRTVTSYSEVLYVLNTDLNHVFLRGGEYLLFFFIFSCGAATQRGSWFPHS